MSPEPSLLECLLQIKGLRETAERLAALARTVDAERWTKRAPDGTLSAGELVGQWVEVEIVHGASLRLMLSATRPVLPSIDERALLAAARSQEWRATDAVAHFLAYRRENLELLERCSAGDLARTGLQGGRREVTIADLVADMLADDVQRFGEIRGVLRIVGSGL